MDEGGEEVPLVVLDSGVADAGPMVGTSIAVLVDNPNVSAARRVVARFSYFDTADQLISTEPRPDGSLCSECIVPDSSVIAEVVPPGRSAITARGPLGAARVEVEVSVTEWEPWAGAPSEALDATVVKTGNPWSTVEVEAENSTPEERGLLVVFVYFDEDGNLLGGDTRATEPVAPGESVPLTHDTVYLVAAPATAQAFVRPA